MRRKIFFAIDQDEDGYPPVAVESVWGEEIHKGQFIIDNIPFFAQQATLGDIVETTLDRGILHYVATIQRSGNSLIRVSCFKDTDPERIRKDLERLGCETEIALAYRLVAVSIPQQISLEVVQRYLSEQAQEGYVDYEEPILRQ